MRVEDLRGVELKRQCMLPAGDRVRCVSMSCMSIWRKREKGNRQRTKKDGRSQRTGYQEYLDNAELRTSRCDTNVTRCARGKQSGTEDLEGIERVNLDTSAEGLEEGARALEYRRGGNGSR